jgi:hypothetical protein
VVFQCIEVVKVVAFFLHRKLECRIFVIAVNEDDAVVPAIRLEVVLAWKTPGRVPGAGAQAGMSAFQLPPAPARQVEGVAGWICVLVPARTRLGAARYGVVRLIR